MWSRGNQSGNRTICMSYFFILDEVSVEGSVSQTATGESFHALFSADGGFAIEYNDGEVGRVGKGESVLIPAALGPYSISADEKIIVLKTTVPKA